MHEIDTYIAKQLELEIASLNANQISAKFKNTHMRNTCPWKKAKYLSIWT
jgi:hypothetical protein